VGEIGNVLRILVLNLLENDYSDEDMRMILKFIVMKWVVTMWIELAQGQYCGGISC
jgi:hypothetical protein